MIPPTTNAARYIRVPIPRRPGRLSEHEPLVHAIDNWVLDHVLGVDVKERRFKGFSLQDLDVLPENVVS